MLGANDGLVSNFCLVMGVAGAGTSNQIVLLTGLAGLIAGACSMALGEWLSVTNARELAEKQIAQEADELEQTPLAEQHELALIFQAKGLPKDDAQRVAGQIMQDKRGALDTLAREEARNRPGGTRRQSVDRCRNVLRLVLSGRDLPGDAVSVDERPLGNRCKRRCKRSGALRDGNADLAVQRAQSVVLGGPSDDLRLSRRGSDLWTRRGLGDRLVLKSDAASLSNPVARALQARH